MRMLRGYSRQRRWSRVLLLLGLLPLLKVPVYAQVGGANVGGVVADASGAALPGFTITITNTANGCMQSLVTSGEGRYRAVALQPGPYEIVAELTGFGTGRRNVVLVVGADATVDITLGIANHPFGVVLPSHERPRRPAGPVGRAILILITQTLFDEVLR